MPTATSRVVRKYPVGAEPIDCDEKMTLKQMQEFVGGWIEIVASKIAHRSLVVNEEGTIHGLPPNPAATEIVREGTMMKGGYLRGNCLLIKSR